MPSDSGATTPPLSSPAFANASAGKPPTDASAFAEAAADKLAGLPPTKAAADQSYWAEAMKESGTHDMERSTDLAMKIRSELASYLKKDLDAVRPEHSLRDDLGLDSMATIELLYRIEEAFDLRIPDEDLPPLVTVGHVVAYVERRLKPAAPSRSSPRGGRKKRG